MAYKIPEHRWDTLFAALGRGRTQKEAAELAGISITQVEKLFRTPERTTGADHLRRYRTEHAPGQTRYRTLSVQAQAALSDFALFRRRYFGRAAVPWQTDLAEKVVGWLAEPERVYAVVNVPPGAGKTTFMRDLICWLTCRDRELRTMWGSQTHDQADGNTTQIRDEFTRTLPYRAGVNELEKGLATDADATLAGDYGRFKPDRRGETDFWSQRRFTVVTANGEPSIDKEPTVTAFGVVGGYMGGRYNLVVWDDIENLETMTASEQVRETFFNKWGQVAENRVEPGGLFLLVMQRLGASDLSRHCLDQVDADGQPVYRHFRYPAHFDLQCDDDHGPDARPWPGGCLLDPLRLPWRDLKKMMVKPHAHYRVTYQQEEADPSAVLIPRLWIDGGINPATGESLPGCWDDGRAFLDKPVDLPPGWRTILSIDPSGKKFWALQTWVVHPGQEKRWLVDHHRETLSVDALLEQQVYSGEFTGIVEDMWQRAKAAGMPIRHLVVEYNTLQSLIFVNKRWDDWRATRGVTFVPHYTTGRNKPDPDKGLGMLRDPYCYGRVRLPGANKTDLAVFVEEHANHPYYLTDDTVMADWFVELRYRRLFPATETGPPAMSRPGWVARHDRYAVA